MRNFFCTTLLLGSLLITSCQAKARMLNNITELDGVWNLEIVNSVAIATIDIAKEEIPSFTFDTTEKTITGQLPCNKFFSSFSYDSSTPDQLSFGEIGQTIAYCHLGDFEDEVLSAIKSVNQVRIKQLSADSIGLIFYDSSNKEIITLVKSKS